jgi:ABC-type amino acid transport substrate-binding protein
VRPYPNADASRAALRKGEVDLLFGDAISLAFWLNGTIPRIAVHFAAALTPTTAISVRASASRSERAMTRSGWR